MLSQALDGIRVLDLTGFMAGPYGSMMLADLGAEVIKVERTGTGDDARAIPPFVEGESSYFISLNRNKKSLTLNLKTDEGKKIIYDLIRHSDVFLENFQPGTTKKLGVDYETVSKINPRIVYCSISGFGQDGPYRNRVAYDLIVLGMGGVLGLTGEKEGVPVKPGVGFSDIIAGMFAVYGVLAALIARQKIKKGQYIDVSLLDGQIAMLTYQASNYFITGKVPERMGTQHPAVVPYGVFKTEDSYISLVVANDTMWRRLCKALGVEDLAVDPRFQTVADRVRNRNEVNQMLERIFATKQTSELVALLEKAEVASGPVYSLDEVFKDLQVLHRGMVAEIDHPKSGKIKVGGIPVKLSETPGNIRSPPPMLGQHTREILEGLGYSQDKIDELRKKGVI